MGGRRVRCTLAEMRLPCTLLALCALGGCGRLAFDGIGTDPSDADVRADAGPADAGSDASPPSDGGADMDTPADAGPPTDAGLPFVVVNTNDDGPGSLRAVLSAVSAAGGGTVRFDIPDSDSGHAYFQENGADGFSAPVATSANDATIADFDADYAGGTARSFWAISLASPLPEVSADIILDGASQSVARGISAVGPTIELRGDGAGAATDGLVINGANVTIAGLAIGGFGGVGVRFAEAATGFKLNGTFVGVDITGTRGTRTGGAGVRVDADDGAISECVIGASDRDGVSIVEAARIELVGNLVGVGLKGMPIGHQQAGVYIFNASFVTGTDNHVANNRVHGWSIASSRDITLTTNQIEANGLDGVFVSGVSQRVSIGGAATAPSLGTSLQRTCGARSEWWIPRPRTFGTMSIRRSSHNSSTWAATGSRRTTWTMSTPVPTRFKISRASR